ncbi:protein of unknown function [Xenorhabdus nematophila AN6/1]|nr:protein of unknown function [Xenorhabdus nematophila AN6/1]
MYIRGSSSDIKLQSTVEVRIMDALANGMRSYQCTIIYTQFILIKRK